MELEEGEYTEKDELLNHCQLQRNKDELSAHRSSSTVKRRREEDDYETVSMEMDSDPEITKDGRSAAQHSEDDVELLRRQLLSQVRKKKKANQAIANRATSEAQKQPTENEHMGTTAKMNELTTMREKLSQFNEQLTEAQLVQSTIIRRKKRLQEAMDECETDLTNSQSKISSVIEAILDLWEQASSSGLKTSLINSKEELRPKQNGVSKNKSKKFSTSENTSAVENIVRKTGQNESETDKASKSTNLNSETGRTDNQTEKGKENETICRESEDKKKKQRELAKENGRKTSSIQPHNGDESRQGRRRSSSIRHSLNQSTFDNTSTTEANEMTETAYSKKRKPVSLNSQTERNGLEKETTGRAAVLSFKPSIPIPPANTKKMPVGVTGNVAQQKQLGHEITVPLPTMLAQIDRVDSFLASIRAYRLSPRFQHRLHIHHSFSNNLDPFVPLCPFQLHGRCADINCPWQHENEYRLSEVDIVTGVIALWPSICPKGIPPDEYATTLLANNQLDVVVGFLLSTMPEEALSIRLDAFSGIPRLTSKPIPIDEDIEFVSFLSSKPTVQSSSSPISCLSNAAY